MSVLVTGGTGTLGHHVLGVIPRARGELHSLATTPPVEHRKHAHVRYLQCDLLDFAQVLDVVQLTKPRQVYHVASQSNVGISQKKPFETISTNVLGTQNLLEAIRRTCPDCQVLLVSSSDVYGPGEGLLDTAHKETDPFRPLTPYASSKACMEILGLQYQRAHGMHVVIVRPFNFSGPSHSRRFVLPAVAEQLVLIKNYGAEPVLYTGNLDVSRDITDVRDLARALVLLMNTARSGSIYNACCGRIHCIRDLVELMAEQQGLDVEIRRDPDRERQIELPLLMGSPEKLMNATGWKPVISMEDSLLDLFAEMEIRVARERSKPRPTEAHGLFGPF